MELVEYVKGGRIKPVGRDFKEAGETGLGSTEKLNFKKILVAALQYNCCEKQDEEALRSRQRAILMGWYCAVAYPAFYLLDRLVYPNLVSEFANIRICVAGLGIATLLLSQIPGFNGTLLRRCAQISAIMATGGVAMMCSLTEGFASNYLIGLVLCFLAITTIELFAPIALAGVLALLLASYFVLCFGWGPPSTIATVVSALFFGIGAYLFSTIAGIILFVQRYRVQAAKLKITEQKAEIEKAYGHQRHFLATMTHELRAPLNSILGFTELVLARESSLNEKSRKNLVRLEQCGRQLLDLINDLLDLSKLDAGRIEVESSTGDLRPLLDEVLESTRALLGNRPVEVILEAPSQLEIASDFKRIRQILVNLASNAAKFTTMGSIRIEAELCENGVQIVVRDTGIGIPESQQKEVFAAFAQGRNVQGSGGTGLGLSIVTRFTQCLGGEVALQSKEGSGSCFTVILPNLEPLRKVA